MFGDKIKYSDRGKKVGGKKVGFTPTSVSDLLVPHGALPIFFDDVSSTRFANPKDRVSETLGEIIAKEFDQVANNGNEYYPCLVAAMNADAREFSTAVRKRYLLVYGSQCVAEDDVRLKAELDAALAPRYNSIGTAFYAEYLDRMSQRIEQIGDGQWRDFDYLLESTKLIHPMMDENLEQTDDMP